MILYIIYDGRDFMRHMLYFREQPEQTDIDDLIYGDDTEVCTSAR